MCLGWQGIQGSKMNWYFNTKTGSTLQIDSDEPIINKNGVRLESLKLKHYLEIKYANV